MRKNILFYVFFSLNICFSQIKKGTILYSVKINKNISEYADFPKEMKENIEKTNSKAEVVEYSLNFNENETYFFANSIIEEGKMTLKDLVIIGGGKLKYYENKETNEHREFVDYMRTGSAILNKQVISDWTLTSEIKIIDGRKCIKATSPNINSKGIKSTNRKFDITAWFTPEIPVPYGPVGYGGLPGLIMELQFYANTFYAKKINLNPDKEVIIDRLTSMPAVSEEELNKRAMSTLSKVQLEGVKEAEEKQKEIKK
jgi:GLPGLI family protein